jgi:hypothetical protein
MADDNNPITDAPKTDTVFSSPAAKTDAPKAAPEGGAQPLTVTGQATGGAASFAGYPMTKYHPVYGAKSVNDPNEGATTFQPAYNWFDSAAEADAHRTDREAQEVIHYNARAKVDTLVAVNNGGEAIPTTGDNAPEGIVRNSVQAQEAIDAGKVEPI